MTAPSRGNNGQQWTTINNNGQQWTTMDYNGQQWTTMDNNGQQSAVLHASLMRFFHIRNNIRFFCEKSTFIKFKRTDGEATQKI